MAHLRTSSIGTPSYRSLSVICRIRAGSTARPSPSQESLISPVSRSMSSGWVCPSSTTLMHVRRGRRLRLALPGALARPLFAIQHVGARHFVLARAHQGEFDLVLDVFDVEGAAVGLPAHQRVDHGLGKRLDQLANAGRRSTLAAVDREERLGHRNRDLARLEGDHGAVAADDLVLRVTLRISAARDCLPRSSCLPESAAVRLVASCIFSPPRIFLSPGSNNRSACPKPPFGQIPLYVVLGQPT